MLMLSPIIYLLLGLGLGKTSYEIKETASAFLTKIVIPLVIIFNIVTNRSGVFPIMLGMIAIMFVMLLISKASSRDPIQNLCFCYLNIGWLGLPIASTFLGDGAAMVIIAAYVGSSLFGNSVGVGMLMEDKNLKSRILQTLQAPPVLALLIGFACLPLKGQIEEFCMPAYEILKWMMGFLGMTILGIWLAKSSLKVQDFKTAIIQFAARSFTMFLLLNLFIVICGYYGITLVTENKATLYLICLLPPAANIIVLETHYLKSGRSASMIACGTCISIVAIFIYVCSMMGMQSDFWL
jgi:predicted permease